MLCFSSLCRDEDNDIAHEFYEETKYKDGKTRMKRVFKTYPLVRISLVFKQIIFEIDIINIFVKDWVKFDAILQHFTNLTTIYLHSTTNRYCIYSG